MQQRARVGTRIRLFRRRRGLTQGDLAAQMQVRGHETLNIQRISEIELDRRRVTAEELLDFARVFAISVNELLGVPGDKPPP